MTIKGGRQALQTVHALQASDLAAALNESLQKMRIAPGDYVPELTAPQGPSTAGGVQAMQHLRLVAGQSGLPTLVVGYANHAAGTAELRNYEYVDAVFRQRFHRPLALDRAQYDAFLGLAQQVFTVLRLQTSIVGPPANLDEKEPDVPAPAALSKMTIAVVVAIAFLILAITTWALFGRG
jgi:hypothetical protein